MSIEETIRQCEREAMESDFRARHAVARADAMRYAINTAMRLQLYQLAAPWIALAAHIRAEQNTPCP